MAPLILPLHSHMLSVADAATDSASSRLNSPLFLVEGRPSANDVLQALAMTCMQRTVGSGSGQAYKPHTMLLPFRCANLEPQEALRGSLVLCTSQLATPFQEWGR